MVTVPTFTGFSITTADRAASLAFYGALGFRVEEDKHGGGRSCIDAPNQHFDVDDVDAVPSWNQGSRGPGVVISFEVKDRQGVDEIVERLASMGYVVEQSPYDAPWGRRFAVVEDPDGNPVALMSAT
jgi:catechol 2,3-dioxygenase-like lactoylglutathione lyase family enzyme